MKIATVAEIKIHLPMQPCTCLKGTLLEDPGPNYLVISCSKCGRGWLFPSTPSHLSPCMDPRFSPPEPRAVIRDPFDDPEDRDEKPEEEEG